MKKNTAGYKMVIAVLAGAMLIMPVTAFARGREQQRGHARHEVVMVDHQRYHYRDGRFYRPGWFWFEFAVITPPYRSGRHIPAGRAQDCSYRQCHLLLLR